MRANGRAWLAALGCAVALAGCAVAPPKPPEDGPIAQCREVFRRVDRAVAEAGVQDGMAARVTGFPYLRVDRFLASYAGQALSDGEFADWMNRLIELGRQGYAVELANLPTERAEALAHALWDIDRRLAWPGPALADCTARVSAADYGDPQRRAGLREHARVPDDYVTWHRVAGLYWLTRLPFASGIARWHRQVRETYALSLSALPVSGELRRYAPPPPAAPTDGFAEVMRRASRNALGIPDPRGADLEALFRAYAPEFEVDTASAADVPGELGWDEGTAPRVVSAAPVVYRRVSHARYQGQALLQLNYWVWFPERPRRSGWDLLGGHLDGVLWRVTLAPDGTPWVYDSIHACGCYHLFFPTGRARVKPQPESLDETVFVPQALPRAAPGERIQRIQRIQRIRLRLAAGTHYVQRIVVAARPAAGAREYRFVEDDVLRSLPLPGGGRRSAFGPDGIVRGTERGERYVFWPMGVPEPGAMRQWGRHPTAFVGRRHFDDPDLMERYFEMLSSE